VESLKKNGGTLNSPRGHSGHRQSGAKARPVGGACGNFATEARQSSCLLRARGAQRSSPIASSARQREASSRSAVRAVRSQRGTDALRPPWTSKASTTSRRNGRGGQIRHPTCASRVGDCHTPKRIEPNMNHFHGSARRGAAGDTGPLPLSHGNYRGLRVQKSSTG